MPPTCMTEIIFSESALASKLLKLKLNKSPGPDMMHPRVLYELRDELVSLLTVLFYNKSLLCGLLPDDWKLSLVSVLYKKGKKDCFDHECVATALGVLMDSDLSFDNHIYEKVTMADKMLEIIERNFY